MTIDIVKLTEYDIQSAAYSIIVNEKLYEKFEGINIHELNAIRSNKYLRNKLIGNLQRNVVGLSKYLTETYKVVLEKFMIINNIKDSDVYFKTKDSIIFKQKNGIVIDKIDNYIFVNKNNYDYYFEYTNNNFTRQVFLGDEDFSIKGITRILENNYPIFKFIFKKMITKHVTTKDTLSLYLDMNEILHLCKVEMSKKQIGFEVEYSNLIVKIDYLPNLPLSDLVFTQEVFEELNAFAKSF